MTQFILPGANQRNTSVTVICLTVVQMYRQTVEYSP